MADNETTAPPSDLSAGEAVDETTAAEFMSALDAEFAELETEIARIGALPQAGTPQKVAMLQALRAKWKERNTARVEDEDRPRWRRSIDEALQEAIGQILDDQAVDIDGNLAFNLETDTVQRNAPKVMQALAAGLGEAMASGAVRAKSSEPETGPQQLLRQLLAGFGSAMGQALKPAAAKAAAAPKPTGRSHRENGEANAAVSDEALGEGEGEGESRGESGSLPTATEAPPETAQALGSKSAAKEPASAVNAGSATHYLLDALSLDEGDGSEAGRFIGLAPVDGRRRIFGGTLLGQALQAACLTVDMSDRVPHVLHANFLRPGEPTVAVDYAVETLLDGASFSSRQVRASQDGQLLFLATASFHVPEPGLAHQITMPSTEPPDEFPTYVEQLEASLERAPKRLIFRAMARQPQLFERRDVDPTDMVDPQPTHGERRFWFKATQPLPDVLSVHYAALAWASDIGLLTRSGEVHGLNWLAPGVTAASLDHALWFHRPFRADNWLLYVSQSPSAEAGRGFCVGRIFARDGTLVASVAQEGLVRIAAG